MHLAFVTDSLHPHFAEDDKLLVSYLQSVGIIVSPAIWDDSSIDWTFFDHIIIRSPWDYFLKLDVFTNWLDQLEKLKLNVYNPISVIQWNKNKNYLLRFKQLGIPIPEFEYCTKGSSFLILDVLQKNKWNKAVIKPSISGGAYKTWITDLNQAKEHQIEFDDLLIQQGLIIQKFSEEIITQGELSLIYFNKKYSHAVRKKAKAGEFRVQSQYGGKHETYFPKKNLLLQIDKILSMIDEPLLYARIDGYLNENNIFFLMELELLEPVLFFDSDPQTCKNFHQAFIEVIP